MFLQISLAKKLPNRLEPRNTIMSDNASCFTARSVRRIISRQGITWTTILECDLMSNGSEERIFSTTEKVIGRFRPGY